MSRRPEGGGETEGSAAIGRDYYAEEEEVEEEEEEEEDWKCLLEREKS